MSNHRPWLCRSRSFQVVHKFEYWGGLKMSLLVVMQFLHICREPSLRMNWSLFYLLVFTVEWGQRYKLSFWILMCADTSWRRWCLAAPYCSPPPNPARSPNPLHFQTHPGTSLQLHPQMQEKVQQLRPFFIQRQNRCISNLIHFYDFTPYNDSEDVKS